MSLGWVTINGNYIYIDDESIDDSFSLSDAITEFYTKASTKTYVLPKKECATIQSEINRNYGCKEQVASYVTINYNGKWNMYFFIRYDYETKICLKVNDTKIKIMENNLRKGRRKI